MANHWKKIFTAASAVIMLSLIATGFNACSKNSDGPYNIEKRARTGWKDEKVYTFNDYTSVMPSVWNEIATSEQANRNLYHYLNSSFFEFDYQFEQDGSVLPGEFEVEYSAATALEDVSADYAGRFGIPAGYSEGHRAWKITLRDDLKWDDGTEIHAEDFVYTMKQQLSPNYLFPEAANFYSGNYILHNAREYVYQGQTGVLTSNTVKAGEQYQTVVLGTDGYYHRNTADGETIYVAITVGSDWSSDALADYAASGYLGDVNGAVISALAGQVNEDGYVPLTEQVRTILEEFCANYGGGYEDEWQEFCSYYYDYPALDFSEVGIFAVSDNELVFITDNMLNPLDEGGDLTYEAAYYLQSLPLVKQELWEKLENTKTKPYTNSYNTTSVANSASWGPYKLTEFQAGTTYTLTRNENWYGYRMEKYEDQYQTDRIIVRYIPEWNTAWQLFRQGGLNSIGMDVTIASDYRNSSRAYFTPSDAIFSLHFNSIASALTKQRGNAMLKYRDFRQALSLSIDRNDYVASLTASNLPSLGLFNDMHYYDVANGGVYRDTVVAKEALLRTYGATRNDNGDWVVGGVTYHDIDEAEAALTGYNLTLARQLFASAYEDAIAAGDFSSGDTVTLRYGATENDSSTQRIISYLNTVFSTAVQGTPFEGKIKVEFYQTTDATWVDDFRVRGAYDICPGGWNGGAWDPYYFIGAYILDANRYAVGWDVSGSADDVMLTLTVDGGDAFKTVTDTMNVSNWYASLNGLGGRYDFSLYPTESRLAIVAALEEKVLESYWSIPIQSKYSSSLISYKCDYICYEYNTFMAYGGIQYMSYNFDDTEWEVFLKENGRNGVLNYTF